MVPGCFAFEAAPFAGHANDEKRAFELLKVLRDQQVGWQDVQEAFENYLMSKVKETEYAAEQMKKVEAHFRPWLLD